MWDPSWGPCTGSHGIFAQGTYTGSHVGNHVGTHAGSHVGIYNRERYSCIGTHVGSLYENPMGTCTCPALNRVINFVNYENLQKKNDFSNVIG